jgi:hypothetical protein
VSACCRIYAAACTIRQPNCHNGIRQSTPKAACRQPNPLPPQSNHDRKRAELTSGHFYTVPGTSPHRSPTVRNTMATIPSSTRA